MNRLFSAATALRVSLIAAAVLAPLAASAQGLDLKLTSVGAATPGSTVQYFATLTNLLPSDNLYISDLIIEGDILTSPNFTVDDNPFFNNVPNFLTEDTDPNNVGQYYLTPGQKVMFEVFGVQVGANAKVGVSSGGMISIAGGGPGGSDVLNADPVAFTIKVTNAVTVPEAGTLALLLPAFGMGAVVVARRRK